VKPKSRVQLEGRLAGKGSLSKSGPDANTITLIMLSGGADSTAALVKLLSEGEEHVHAHHIYLKNQSARALPELQATYDIVDYCKRHYRPFDFTLSTIDVSFMRNIPPDIFHTNYIAAMMVITDSRIKKLTRCVIVEDEADTTYDNRKNAARKLFQTLVPEGRRPEYIYPVREMTKADILTYLPLDLLKITWSCRTPIVGKTGFMRCGECHTCEQVRDSLVARKMDQGWLSEEVAVGAHS